MADRRDRDRARHHSRPGDRWIGALVVVAALVAGLLAAHFATAQPWEKPSTTTSVTERQGSP
jgi:hypothetical protein